MTEQPEMDSQKKEGTEEPVASPSWSDVVLSVIPAEVTAAYLGVRALVATIAQSNEEVAQYDPLVMVALIVLLTVLSPWITSALRGGTKAKQQIIPALSFAIWALNIDYQRVIDLLITIDAGDLARIIATYAIPILLILWAALVVPVYRRFNEQKSQRSGVAK